MSAYCTNSSRRSHLKFSGYVELFAAGAAGVGSGNPTHPPTPPYALDGEPRPAATAPDAAPGRVLPRYLVKDGVKDIGISRIQ